MTRTRTSRDLRIRSHIIGPMLRGVERAGGDASTLASSFGLPKTAATDPEATLPLAELQAFFDAAERASGDPLLGLHVAEQTPKGQWGALEYGPRSASTLREALGRVVRYFALFNENVVVSFETSAHEGVIVQQIQGRPLCLGRHGNEFFVAAILRHAREAVSHELIPSRVFFAHAEPAVRPALERAFGTTEISFDAERNGLAIRSADLDRPLVSRDPRLLALVDAFAARELEERGASAGSGLLGQVRAAVRVALPEGAPSLEAVARGLKMSPRSLQRRLTEEGTTFQVLVETLRQELAREWLTKGSRPIAEIAFLLGYSELGAFIRAFRRWSGETPAAHRAQAAALVKAGKRT